MWLRLTLVVMTVPASVFGGIDGLAAEWAAERAHSPEGRRSIQLMRAVGLPPDDWQLEVLRTRADRLLLNITRQGGKSTAPEGSTGLRSSTFRLP